MNSIITLGADPELFIMDKGKFVSAHDVIKGNKYEPHELALGAVQVDGVSAEFNILPSSCLEDFVENIASVLNDLSNMVQEKLPESSLVFNPTATFDKDYFDGLPTQAKLLGCEPDYNAYTGEENEPPVTNEPFRTGAGHIHIGYTAHEDPFNEDHFNNCMDITKQLDHSLFIQSFTWDDDTKRRTLYGKAGSFRSKGYGVEYRPLSNAWLREKKTVEQVYNTTIKAVELLNQGTKLYEDKNLFEIVSEGLEYGTKFDKNQAQRGIDILREYGVHTNV